ncbi:molybdopterin biosynthesis protein MoeA, partial [Paenibacillus darwinianus]
MDFQGKTRFDRRAVRVDEAQRRLLEAVRPLAAEPVPLWRCVGRYPAEHSYATADWPPFARSGLDGYAVQAADIAQATPERPALLRVIDTIAAGQVSTAIVEPGTAVRIMTGAAVPEGADAVVMLEQTANAPAAGPGETASVLVKQPVASGRNIASRGEEFSCGSGIARPGERLRPGHIALLGTFGYAELSVVRRPRVAIFATGTELLSIEAPLEPGRIRDSNSSMVAALVKDAGCEPLPYGR